MMVEIILLVISELNMQQEWLLRWCDIPSSDKEFHDTKWWPSRWWNRWRVYLGWNIWRRVWSTVCCQEKVYTNLVLMFLNVKLWYKAFFVQIHWLFFRGKKLKNPKFSECKMHWQNLVSLETLNVFRHIRLLFQLLIKHFNLILYCDSSTWY